MTTPTVSLPLPLDVGFGTIMGRFGLASTLVTDDDGNPDFIPMAGLKITFTANIPFFLDHAMDPIPSTVVLDPIVCTIDPLTGQMLDPRGALGVNLVAGDNPDIDPHGNWTYTVTFSGHAAASKIKTQTITMPMGSIRYLTNIISVPNSTGMSLTQAQLAEDHVVLIAADIEMLAQQIEDFAAFSQYSYVEDPNCPGLYVIPAGSFFYPDAAHQGLYLMSAGSGSMDGTTVKSGTVIYPDTAHGGLYLMGGVGSRPFDTDSLIFGSEFVPDPDNPGLMLVASTGTGINPPVVITRNFDNSLAAQRFLNLQLLPLVQPTGTAEIGLGQRYPTEYTGAVTGSFSSPPGYATVAGTYITISDPGDLLPTYRGIVTGKVVGLTGLDAYKVQPCKVTDVLTPIGARVNVDTGGNFTVNLATVPSSVSGSWVFRLESTATVGVAVGGLWPTPQVYSGLAVELHTISDDDHLIASQPAQVDGKITFLQSSAGLKRLVLRDTATQELLADTMPITGNIRSFVVSSGQPGYGTRFEEQCYVYDQAVALCAAIAVGDQSLASRLMAGISRLQTTSDTNAGGFRFSGRQGSAQYVAPAYRTGAHCLALFAVLAYAQTVSGTAGTHARDVATSALQWLALQKSPSTDMFGLYLGGNGSYQTDSGGGQTLYEDYPLTSASTEHNIAAYYALKLAGRVLGGTYNAESVALGANMMGKLWNSTENRLHQGLQPTGPDTADSLDLHSWGAVFLKDVGESGKALLTIGDPQLTPFRFSTIAPNGRPVTGYSTAYASLGYPNMVRHVWWEGTFSVAYALSKLGDTDRFNSVYAAAKAGQFPDGSYPYVSHYDATYQLVPYRSVASTAWAILANIGSGVFDTGAL